ncbi:Subtilisin-like protease SBT4.14 [Linum perenne]
MRIFTLSLPLVFSLVLISVLITIAASAHVDDQKEFHIVYLGDKPKMSGHSALKQLHMDVLSSVKTSGDVAMQEMVYSYTKASFNAFAAKLTPSEAQKLSKHGKVLGVFQNRYHKLDTTKSWDFVGLPKTAKRNLKMEKNIVVGLLDTGITPQSISFNVDGHGTHTSSTLAGNVVPGASLFGLAKGSARGAVPGARIAMYKVCWVSSGCSDMDLLAGFEAAIHDGVDVISISIGGVSPDYVSDVLAIGAFHATKNGILTVASAGNDGPNPASVRNHAPWMLTVAASGIDRTFRSKVHLGNGKLVSVSFPSSF